MAHYTDEAEALFVWTRRQITRIAATRTRQAIEVIRELRTHDEFHAQLYGDLKFFEGRKPNIEYIGAPVPRPSNFTYRFSVKEVCYELNRRYGGDWVSTVEDALQRERENDDSAPNLSELDKRYWQWRKRLSRSVSGKKHAKVPE